MSIYDGQKFVMGLSRGADQDTVFLQPVWQSRFVADQATGLFEKKQARRDIVRLQVAFPEALQLARGNVAEVERG